MPELKWKAISEFDLLSCELDNQYLIYNSGSSDTHLIELSAKTVIDALNKACLTVDELTAYLNDTKENSLPFETSDVTEILKQLKKIHLVKVISS